MIRKAHLNFLFRCLGKIEEETFEAPARVFNMTNVQLYIHIHVPVLIAQHNLTFTCTKGVNNLITYERIPAS